MPTEQSSVKPLTYSTYLKIEELLDLQQPLSDGPEHDEMLFIVIHQVYELWFKQVIHEMGGLQSALAAGNAAGVLATLKRILTILKTLVAQVDVLETMTPVSFNAFRDRLESGSGFQSVQFRVLEFMLGHKRTDIVMHHPPGSRGGDALAALMPEPTVWDSYVKYLADRGYAVPDAVLSRDVSLPIEPNVDLQAVLIELYESAPVEAMIAERLLDLDEGLQEWRYRHVKMVERTIGEKTGTGGSSGVHYLRSTLFHPVFPDLWAMRTAL